MKKRMLLLTRLPVVNNFAVDDGEDRREALDTLLESTAGLQNDRMAGRNYRSALIAIPAPAATNMPPLMRFVTVTNLG